MRYRISDTSLGVFLEVGLKGGKLGALLEERKISNRDYRRLHYVYDSGACLTC